MGSILNNLATGFVEAPDINTSNWNKTIPGDPAYHVAIAKSANKIGKGQYVEFYHSIFDFSTSLISTNKLLFMYWLEGLDVLGVNHVYGALFNNANINGSFRAFADNIITSNVSGQGTISFRRAINRTADNIIQIIQPSNQAILYSAPSLVDGDMFFHVSATIPQASIERCKIRSL